MRTADPKFAIRSLRDNTDASLLRSGYILIKFDVNAWIGKLQNVVVYDIAPEKDAAIGGLKLVAAMPWRMTMQGPGDYIG